MGALANDNLDLGDTNGLVKLDIALDMLLSGGGSDFMLSSESLDLLLVGVGLIVINRGKGVISEAEAT